MKIGLIGKGAIARYVSEALESRGHELCALLVRSEKVADGVAQNIHEVTASGDFGRFQFQISGNSLPDNPRTSALAAMSVLSKLDQLSSSVTL